MRFKDIQATIRINLTKQIDELWSRLDKDARWGVNKARKEGLSIEKVENEEAWKEFYEIYKETCNRGGIFPLDFEKIKNNVLFACKKEGKIIAGAVIKEREDIIELFLNSSKGDFLKFQPNNLLYWAIIEYGKKNNFKIFDLGGYQLKAPKGSKLYEINRFKERWGGEIFKYYIYSNNPFYILGRKIIRNVPIAKKIRDKLRFSS